MMKPVETLRSHAQSRCLIVEDSQFDQSLLTRVLNRAAPGLRIDVVATIADAKAAIERAHYVLLLLDNGLPDGSGVEFALQLRRDPAHDRLPIIMLSDWPTPFMFDKAMLARIRLVLSKSEFNIAHVTDVLSRPMLRTGTTG